MNLKRVLWLLTYCSFIMLTSCGLLGSDENSDHDIPRAVGAGYDTINDEYADIESVKEAILDLDRLYEDDNVRVETLEKSEFVTITGESLLEYATNLSVKAKVKGSYYSFKGSLKTNFNLNESTVYEESFATVKTTIKKRSYVIPNTLNSTELQDYLTDSAREHLNNSSLTPEELFETYGTYVITGAITGGRLDYNIQAESSEVSSFTSVEVLAKASYNSGVKSISGSVDTSYSEEQLSAISSVNKNLIVYGGSSEEGQKIISSNNYDNWVSSVSDNTVFCDFAEDGLIPIWELAESVERQTEIEEAYIELANSMGSELEDISSDTVTLYEDRAYQGASLDIVGLIECEDLSSSDYDFNNEISSVKVTDGYVVSFWDGKSYSGAV